MSLGDRPVRPVLLLSALVTLLTLETLRAAAPLFVDVSRAGGAATAVVVTLIVLALPAVAGPLTRWLTPPRATAATVALLVLLRLLLQLQHTPGFLLTTLTTATALTALLLTTHHATTTAHVAAGPVTAAPVATGPVAADPVAADPVTGGPVAAGPVAGGGIVAATGLLLGTALDAASRTAFATWDPLWRPGLLPWLYTIALCLLTLAALARTTRQATRQPTRQVTRQATTQATTHVPAQPASSPRTGRPAPARRAGGSFPASGTLRASGTLHASGTLRASEWSVVRLGVIGLYLVLDLMVFGSPAFVSARSGIGLPYAGALLLLGLLLAIEAVSRSHLPGGSARLPDLSGRRAGLPAAIVLVAAVAVALYLTGPLMVIAVLIAQVASALVLARALEPTTTSTAVESSSQDASRSQLRTSQTAGRPRPGASQAASRSQAGASQAASRLQGGASQAASRLQGGASRAGASQAGGARVGMARSGQLLEGVAGQLGFVVAGGAMGLLVALVVLGYQGFTVVALDGRWVLLLAAVVAGMVSLGRRAEVGRQAGAAFPAGQGGYAGQGGHARQEGAAGQGSPADESSPAGRNSPSGRNSPAGRSRPAEQGIPADRGISAEQGIPVEQGVRGGRGSRRGRWAVVAGVPAVLLVVPVVVLVASRGAGEQGGAADSVRVVSWDVDGAVGDGGAVDAGQVADVVARQRADVVLLQDVGRAAVGSGGVDLAEYLGRALGMGYVWAPTGDGRVGTVVLARLPMSGVRVGRVTDRVGGSYVAVTVETNSGQQLRVVSAALGEGSDRSTGMETLLAVWGQRHPAVIGGALGAGPSSPQVAAAQDAGLASAQDSVGQSGIATTPAGQPTQRPDWIFGTPDVSFDAFAVPTTTASGHRPLAVTAVLG